MPDSHSNLISFTSTFVLIAMTVYLLVVGQEIFVPLVLAILISYLIMALSHGIQSIKIQSWIPPAWVGLIGAILIVFLAVALIVQLVADNINAVVQVAPQYQDRLTSVMDNMAGIIERLLGQPLTLSAVRQDIDIQTALGSIAGALQSIAGNTFQILLYVAFLLFEQQTFDPKIKAMFADSNRERRVRKTLNEIGDKIEKYVWIKTSMSLLVGILSYVVLTFVSLDFAAFWALLIFLLNYIPYIGSLIAVAFPTVLALLQFGSVTMFLAILISLAAIQVLVGNIIEPRITGQSLNLSPVFIVLSLSVWGTVWGVTGMFLSVPMMVMIMIILAQFNQTRPIAVLMSQKGEV